MHPPKLHRLGELQLKIMKILWNRSEASVGLVHQEVGGPHKLAYTTVATMLRKMEDRGLVKHRVSGRSFIYRPAVKSDAVARHMAGNLLDRLFEGKLSNLVSHCLNSREVGAEELERLQQLIAEQKQKL